MKFEDTTAAREKSYPGRMAQTIGGFAVAAVQADCMAKDAALDRVCKILERKNVEVHVAAGQIKGDQVGFGASVPPVILSDMRTFAPDTAKLTMSMKTSEQNQAHEKTGEDASLTGKAGFRAGLFSVSVSFSAHVSHSTDQSRTTDYSATTDVEMTMKQSDPPEGVSMICDCIKDVVNTAMQIQKEKANAKLHGEANTALPPPPEGGGDEGKPAEGGTDEAPADDGGGDK